MHLQSPSVNPLIKLRDRILARWTDDDKQTPGAVFVSTDGGIDDGRYGDPLRDERPDFIREANAGWQPLNR